MKSLQEIPPVAVTIYGAAGDLSWRKLVPALYNLYLDDRLPEDFLIIGMDIKDMSDKEFCDHLLEGINKFSRRGKADKKEWKKFCSHLQYKKGDFTKKKSCQKLADIIGEFDEETPEKVHRLFYLSVPTRFIDDISKSLSESGIADDKEHARLIIEKPFGHDLESAKALNKLLTNRFDERQIYRIDHFLGKETVQNIMVFRFANALFEPIWSRNFIDHVQITVSEELGVGHRGGYYEEAGALRDMVQNHLMQLFCLIAMEPPISFEANEVRNKKVAVLDAVRRYQKDQVNDIAVRGQYGEGWIKGEKVKGYRQEEDVDEESETETYAAVKLFVDNWRWQDVPFYLRTGKCMSKTASAITIQFRDIPHKAFPDISLENWSANKLVISMKPEKGMRLQFQAKKPGLEMKLNPVDMTFNYDRTYKEEPPEAYETLLLDVMEGDATLFMRSDQVEAAWDLLMPIIEVWEETDAPEFPNYEAGSMGPQDANSLIAEDGNHWVLMPLTKNNNGKAE